MYPFVQTPLYVPMIDISSVAQKRILLMSVVVFHRFPETGLFVHRRRLRSLQIFPCVVGAPTRIGSLTPLDLGPLVLLFLRLRGPHGVHVFSYANERSDLDTISQPRIFVFQWQSMISLFFCIYLLLFFFVTLLLKCLRLR